MFGNSNGVDRVVHSRARDRARWAIRDHGDEAEAVISAKLGRNGLGEPERVLYRLTLREIAVLRRARAVTMRQTSTPLTRAIGYLAALIVGKPKKRRRRP